MHPLERSTRNWLLFSFRMITRAGNSPTTPLRRRRDGIVVAKITTRTRTRNASFDCYHHRLRHLLIIFCCWSATIFIATCSSISASSVSRSHQLLVDRETARSVRLLDNLKDRLDILLLRKYERTASFGFYYGMPRTFIESFAPNRRDGDNNIIATGNDDDDVSLAKRRNFETIGIDVEKWADKLLCEGNTNNGVVGIEDENGWTEILCTKAFRHKFNNGNNSTSSPLHDNGSNGWLTHVEKTPTPTTIKNTRA